jgi:hypothetical protein
MKYEGKFGKEVKRWGDHKVQPGSNNFWEDRPANNDAINSKKQKDDGWKYNCEDDALKIFKKLWRQNS